MRAALVEGEPHILDFIFPLGIQIPACEPGFFPWAESAAKTVSGGLARQTKRGEQPLYTDILVRGCTRIL